MNQLMEGHRSRERAAQLEALAQAVKELSLKEIAAGAESVRAALCENSLHLKEFTAVAHSFEAGLDSLRKIDQSSQKIGSLSAEIPSHLGNIQRLFYGLLAISLLIAGELLWIILKR